VPPCAALGLRTCFEDLCLQSRVERRWPGLLQRAVAERARCMRARGDTIRALAAWLIHPALKAVHVKLMSAVCDARGAHHLVADRTHPLHAANGRAPPPVRRSRAGRGRWVWCERRGAVWLCRLVRQHRSLPAGCCFGYLEVHRLLDGAPTAVCGAGCAPPLPPF
jgi:hypothetical protein